MSADAYSFGFCKNILKKFNSKRTVPQKKGDTIAVPDYTDERSERTDSKKRVATPVINHDKLSNSTISDFGNSFNSDMKSFLKVNKNDVIAADEITFPEFEEGNFSYFHLDKSIEKMKEQSKFKPRTSKERDIFSENAQTNYRLDNFNPNNNPAFNYIETVHQINSARILKIPPGILPNLYALCMMPKDSQEDPFVYSDVLFHPVSFLGHQKQIGYSKNDKIKLESPSPTFIDSTEFSIKPDLSKGGILKGMAIHPKLGLILTDESISKKFKGIVGDMMSSMVSSIFTSKPFSLPVKIFEPKSTLQRITEYWSFAPVFLPLAKLQKDSIERLKYVICFAIAGLYPSSKQLKPFNPLLGETFEGIFEDGSTLYCEHISQHPTITRFLVRDKNNKYSFSGFYEFNSKPKSMGGKLIVSQKGPNIIEFPGQNYITYNMPKIKLLNCRSEVNRSSFWKSIMIFADPANSLKAVVRFGKNEELVNNFEGFIYEFKFPSNYKFKIDEEIALAKKAFKDTKLRKHSKISGNWLESCVFDTKTYWHINTHTPSWVCPSINIVPSDGRFREDLIWLFRSFGAKDDTDRKKYEEYSQNWKSLIEAMQRKDRELRAKKK